MYIQVFRESTLAESCFACGQGIYSGDLAYRIAGEAVCADCVSSGKYVAEALPPPTMDESGLRHEGMEDIV